MAAGRTARAAAAHRPGIDDAKGDFLATFAGSSTRTGLDVLSATVTCDAGSTSAGLHGWGVNRAAGTAGFAGIGITGGRFGRVILLRPDGTGTVAAAGALPLGSVTSRGKTLTASVSRLPSAGFGKGDCTWNPWPRDTAFAGTAAIADFAPNNAPFTAVPEPGTAVLGALGLAGLLVRRRPQSNS